MVISGLDDRGISVEEESWYQMDYHPIPVVLYIYTQTPILPNQSYRKNKQTVNDTNSSTAFEKVQIHVKINHKCCINLKQPLCPQNVCYRNLEMKRITDMALK